MDVIARRLAKEGPDAAGFGVRVQLLQDWMYGRFVKHWLLPLFGAVLFVLLIACANVANLMLVRANVRDKEFAIRCAVGGGRGRLIRQLLTESTHLAMLGGALGALLAYAGVNLMVGLDPDAIPKANEIAVNVRVLGFTLFVALVTGLVFGLLPALMASKPNLNESLKETGRRATARWAGRRAHGALVVAEVALSLVLLAGAGLMIRNMWHLLRLDVGFNPENLITMQISLPDMSYCEDGPKERTLKPQAALVRERIRERLRALPGVKSVSVANRAPLWGCASSRLVSIGNQPPPRAGDVNSEDLPFACFQPVSPDYLRMLQVPLLKGREFTERDNEGSLAVSIINESFARRHFPSQEPIGKVVRLGHWDKAGEEPSREIVGVVGDSRQVLFRKPIPALYVPYSQLRPGFAGPQTQERTDIAYLVRASVDPASLAPTLRRVES